MSFGAKLNLDLVMGEAAPPATEALVVPQDVHLIMGEVDPIVDTAETAEEVLAASAEYRPRRPGSLVVAPSREGTLLVLQAIVYDFDRTPSCREEHVFEALVAAFEVAKARGLSSLAVRPLGTAHAGVDALTFLKVLTQICYSSAELGTSLRRVSLLLSSPEELARYEGLLHGLVDKRGHSH